MIDSTDTARVSYNTSPFSTHCYLLRLLANVPNKYTPGALSELSCYYVDDDFLSVCEEESIGTKRSGGQSECGTSDRNLDLDFTFAKKYEGCQRAY